MRLSHSENVEEEKKTHGNGPLRNDKLKITNINSSSSFFLKELDFGWTRVIFNQELETNPSKLLNKSFSINMVMDQILDNETKLFANHFD